MQSVFFRLLRVDDKEVGLRGCIEDRGLGRHNTLTHAVRQETFRLVPGSPMPYWVSDSVRRNFKDLPPFEGSGGTVKQGLATANDFRFVRARWEVAPETVARSRKETWQDKRWVAFAKGGEYSPYYDDVHLVVNWEREGEEIKAYIVQRYPYLNGKWEWVAKNTDYYFRCGLTYPLATVKGFNVRLLSRGCIFGHKGPAMFFSADDTDVIASAAGWANSRICQYFLLMQTASRSWEVGYVQNVPLIGVPRQVGRLGRACHDLKRHLDRISETSHTFTRPPLLGPQVGFSAADDDNPRLADSNLKGGFLGWLALKDSAELKVIEKSCQIDQVVLDLYEISEQDRQMMDRELGPHAGSHPRKHEWTTEDDEKLQQLYSEEGDDLEKIAHSLEVHPASIAARRQALGLHRPQDLAQAVADLISYCFGCLFGRWDIRVGAGQLEPPPLPDPEDDLPLYPPGALMPDSPPLQPVGPLARVIERSASEGILVDDQGHKQDLVAGVEACLTYLFGEEQLPALRREIEDVLGRDLRQWLARDFFPFHIKRYSKSRRKAPIYWQLTTPGRGYSLWVYYHALRPDTLYTAVRQYATPKIEFEEGRLKELRAKFAEVRESGPAREARRLEKAAEDQDAFLQELYALRSELNRLADWGYDPDLNDGVIISIAPLHRHVLWREAAKMWEELEEGKYEWSTMAQHIDQYRRKD